MTPVLSVSVQVKSCPEFNSSCLQTAWKAKGVVETALPMVMAGWAPGKSGRVSSWWLLTAWAPTNEYLLCANLYFYQKRWGQTQNTRALLKRWKLKFTMCTNTLYIKLIMFDLIWLFTNPFCSFKPPPPPRRRPSNPPPSQGSAVKAKVPVVL